MWSNKDWGLSKNTRKGVLHSKIIIWNWTSTQLDGISRKTWLLHFSGINHHICLEQSGLELPSYTFSKVMRPNGSSLMGNLAYKQDKSPFQNLCEAFDCTWAMKFHQGHIQHLTQKETESTLFSSCVQSSSSVSGSASSPNASSSTWSSCCWLCAPRPRDLPCCCCQEQKSRPVRGQRSPFRSCRRPPTARYCRWWSAAARTAGRPRRRGWRTRLLRWDLRLWGRPGTG